MVPEQKGAWFGLALFGIGLIAFLALFPVFGFRGWFAFSICGLYGVSPWIFRKKCAPGEVAMDERDKKIMLRANLAAHVGAYMAAFFACEIPWFVLKGRGEKMITVDALPHVIFAMMFSLIFFRCVAILVGYRRGVGHDEA